MNIALIIENAHLKGRIIALDARVETLTAEVRCLEAVIRSHKRVDCLTFHEENVLAMRDWEAAKEGKQTK